MTMSRQILEVHLVFMTVFTILCKLNHYIKHNFSQKQMVQRLISLFSHLRIQLLFIQSIKIMMLFSSNKNSSDLCFLFFHCMKDCPFLVLEENLRALCPSFVSIRTKPIKAMKELMFNALIFSLNSQSVMIFKVLSLFLFFKYFSYSVLFLI